MASAQSPLAVSTRAWGDNQVLSVDGVLDGSTYRDLRDAVIKAALDEPRAVIVDVTDLQVSAESAWCVFTSARWHISVWPDVPLLLVCRNAAGRDAIRRNGIGRYVPLYATLDSAHVAARSGDLKPQRRRARAQLPAVHSSVRRARQLVAEWLTTWSQTDVLPVAAIVVDVLVENVLEHTLSAPRLIVESRGDAVTIAVADDNRTPAVRHEDPHRGGDTVSGLAVVAALARAWGSTPTSTGKTVWAVVGPENSL
ncbi:STAS domain-containing protein [Mycobacterium aquaticum]|uniref:Sulfate transporter n=1 Tax=Mycobacterium aquaticum TaxID=1927124 RepID=A0A1X0AXU0_9MYCO|nr:STAS domain-containing protein [Mycobacterium aquaticum]ORA34843.1 sulfate transporter [Mycobacterium aquaticum]